MRLRNKKTGEVFDALIRERGCAGSYSIIVCDIKSYEHSKSTLNATHFVLGEYNSLAELNEEWKDYIPAEPLIKDEKVRKAVRAWAEVNEIGGCVCKEEIHCITFETERGMFISFENADPIPPEGNYTIDELCGEEEE